MAFDPDDTISDSEVVLGTAFGGRYQIVRVLGSGGMSHVYLATDRVLDRPVAIKLLNIPRGARRSKWVRRFELETKALASLAHPHVVTVFDFGQNNDGDPYLVMEHLEGRTLAERLAAAPAVPWHEAVEIGIQLCTALAKAHARGLIHRDLKPSNVMLVADVDREPFVKIIDFGLVRRVVLQEDRDDSRLTEQGTILGTPYYIAPEQAMGIEVDARADLYALGATLYHLISGRTPFPGGDLHKLLEHHLRAEVPPINQHHDAACPDAIERVILRCLAKRPDDRYRDASSLRIALLEAQQDSTQPLARLRGGAASAPGAKR